MLRVRLHIDSFMSIPCEVLEEFTMRRPYGWVFFWQSSEYRRTRKPKTQLVGNGPFVVVAATGEIVELGTALSTEAYLAELERERGW